MKKVIKSIFIFLLLCIMVNVNALNVGDQFTLTPGASQTHSASYGFNEQYQLHTVTGGGKTYDAYCMDRGKAAGAGASYVVSRMMPKLKGDYAVLYLMKNGADKEQIHLAIRLLVSKGMLNWSHTGTADYLAKIDAAVNCMKSDSTFNSTLTEFLSNTSKKNSDNDENADEGGKSLALLGFEKYNLLEDKCKYTTAAQCSDATGQGCYKNAEGCFVSTGTSCDKTSNVFECYDGRYQNNTSGKFGCKIIKRCTFSSAAACSDNANLHCKYDSTEKAWVQLNGSSCKSCDKYSSERENDGCRKCDTSNSNGSNNNNCDTAQKLQTSLDNCKNEASKMEQQSFNTKKYTCKLDNMTKCFYVAEDTSGNRNNKCDASGEYTKDQCDGMKKTNNSGSCESVGNGCYKYVTDSNIGGNGGSVNPSGGTSVSCGGFDGIKQCDYTIPRLTTVCQNSKEFAHQGVTHLLNTIADPELVSVNGIVPFSLKEQESVKKI